METVMDIHQYRRALDDRTVDAIMDDPFAVSIIQSLNWTSLSKDELDEIVPGNEQSLDILIRSHIVVFEDGLYSLDVTFQSFGFRLDRTYDICEVLGMPSEMWIRDMGYLSAYITDSLVSLLFGIEPCWESDMAERLAHRAGLIDSEGNITEKGKGRAYAIYSLIADVFDVRPVDPDDLYRKWSSSRAE